MLRRVVGAVVVAVALGAPGVAEAGVLKNLVKSLPVLTKPSSLTPTCVSSGHGGAGRTTCTAAVPVYSCTVTTNAFDDSRGTGCDLGIEGLVNLGCGVSDAHYGPEVTGCSVSVGETWAGCSEEAYHPPAGVPANTTRSCYAAGSTLFSCKSVNGAPVQESPTCGPVARLVDGLLNP